MAEPAPPVWRVQESEEAGVKLARLRASAPNLFPPMDEQDRQDTGPKDDKQDVPAQAEPATTGKKRTKG